MKILVVLTGGTIGSTLQGTHISIQPNKNILKVYEEKFGKSAEFEVISPFNILSECSSGLTLKKLCETVKKYVTKDYDGIIITHGTDTLQYSAAALSYSLGNNSIPVFLVSSNFPLEDERANGLCNLHAAVLFITQNLGNGVFVAYQNNNKITYIHRGTRLLKSDIYSDNVRSIKNMTYGFFDTNFLYNKNESYFELADETPAFDTNSLTESAKGILPLEVCPALLYPKITDEIHCILLSGYHSGTVDTASTKAIGFYTEAKSKNAKVYLTGAYTKDNYETTLKFAELGIKPLPNITPIAAYLKLWFANLNQIDVDDVITKSLGGDLIE